MAGGLVGDGSVLGSVAAGGVVVHTPLSPTHPSLSNPHHPPHRIEPILARIKEDRTVVLCPMIDSIDDNTLQYHYGGGLAVGGFSWSLHFTWRGVPRRDLDRRRSEAEPVR